MGAGRSGLPGQHQQLASMVVEQETKPEREPVQTPAQRLMAETVGGQISE